jgi:alkanesulfonate monooxygenase SsuD/methylene tetrahydromethanopterin reductase-like flavin-dependent oxidoreductase (luciferase family)
MLPVGYLPCTQDPPNGSNMGVLIEEIFDEAAAAEATGWDGCFITEHHQQPDGYLPSPLLMAAMIGARTQRLKVGTCVLLAPLHHPVHLAEDCAIIDQATHGRLILSLGVGYQPHDFEPFGVPITERGTRTEETIAILRHAWAGERFGYDGKHHQFDQILITPRPVHPAGPPIWLAGWTPAGVRRAGRRADGWIADPVQSLGVILEFAKGYRRAAASAGRKPFICLMRDAVIAPSRAQAEALSGPTMVTHRFYFEHQAYVADELLRDVKRAEDLTFAKAAKDRLIVGSPEECLEQLKMWRETLNPDYLILRFRQPGGPSHRETVAAIRLFGEKVLPRL